MVMRQDLGLEDVCESVYWAVRTQAPTALIFSSARLEKNLAFTITGCLGNTPFPKTLKYPALEQSMTGALSFTSAYLVLVCSETRDQSLSRLMAGQKCWKCWGGCGSSSFQPFQSIQDGTCRSCFCGDADHQRFLYLRGASCAFRSYHDPM